MFTIKVDIEPSDSSEAFLRDVFAPALTGAVTDVAYKASDALSAATEELFDRPNPFTRRSFGVLQAQLRSDPMAFVYVKEIQAEYLDLQIEGGIRRAGDYATSRLGPIVPGPHGQKDAYGNLPRGYIRRVMQDPHVAWINLRDGQPPALVRREPGKRMEVLALIVKEIDYAPRFDFYGIVTDAIEREWPKSAEKALEKALNRNTETEAPRR